MISVIIPAYNERNSINKVVIEIEKEFQLMRVKHEIIVVDDGSTDGTIQAIDKRTAKIIRHKQNKGYGASIKTGIRNARFEWILIIDGDGTYPTKAIPCLLKHVKEFDMIVGARTKKDVCIPLMRKPAKWILTKLANYLTSTNIPDLNSGLRIFRKRDALKFFSILPNGFSLTSTITLAFFSNDLSIKYVPITYQKRIGKSKINPFKEFQGFVLRLIRTTIYFNPLKVFIPIGLLLFFFGLIDFLFSLITRLDVTDTSVVLFSGAFQILFLGFIADLIVKKTGRELI